VRAALPADVIGPVVTGQTHLVDLTGLHLLDLADVPTRVVLDVRLTRPVAALAPMSGRGRSWVLLLAVGRTFECVALFAVTLQTLGRADVTPTRRGSGRRFLRRRWLGPGGLRSGLRRRSEGNRSGSTNRDCRSENAGGYQTLTVIHGDSPHTNARLARSRTGLPSSSWAEG
jgi:hypothetical protein